MMSQLSVLYVFSALSKMNLEFISGVPLSGWVWLECSVAGLLRCLRRDRRSQLIIGIGLWFRASRLIAVVFGLGLHLSIVTLMNNQTVALVAFAITCVSLYPLFIFRPALRGPRTESHGRALVRDFNEALT